VSKLEERYIKIFNLISKKKDNLIVSQKNETSGEQGYLKSYDTYYNDFLADIVKKTNEKNKLVRVGEHLVQTYEPIFLIPVNERGISLRTHFFSPVKFVFGKRLDTLIFNIIIIWIMSVLFYTTLYYDILRKIVNMRGRKNNKDKMLQ
jgi:ABC transport system ATP-binding/permease protein